MARQFAIDVVRTLREAGHESLWAGGCVRDALIGNSPKDYDVATNAAPNEVRRVFGHNRTLAIGAAFGVITVLGPKAAGPIEIATFREDVGYSDGRRPDRVVYSTAEQDALRRDFTINGLFYDPLEERVIDYVGGETDLANGVIRAIGDPAARIAEDKLRMLRAVRFAAGFGFEIEDVTWHALCREAKTIHVVSAERIGAEMRRMLVGPNRRRAIELLRDTGLLEAILPETAALPTQDMLRTLEALIQPEFPTALAAILLTQSQSLAFEPNGNDAKNVMAIAALWRLSTEEKQAALASLAAAPQIVIANELPWHQVQPLLIQRGIHETMKLASARCEALKISSEGVEYCREKLALDPEQLNPKPIMSGDILRDAGLKPGPKFKEILQSVRNEQLEGRLCTTEEALEWVQANFQI